MAEYELSDSEREVLRRISHAVDDPDLRAELERLAGPPTEITLGGTPTPATPAGHLELGGQPADRAAPSGATGHIELGGAMFSGTGTLTAAATVAAFDAAAAVDSASATVVLNHDQASVLTGLLQNAGDLVKIGDSVINAGDTWAALGRWLIEHGTYLAQLPGDWIEAFTRWPH